MIKKIAYLALAAASIMAVSTTACANDNAKKAPATQTEATAQAAQAAEAEYVTAPDFTFPDVNGKMVSLSDFRGKWVIIDFWGSWCPWCIKGFPALKEAYAKYEGKVEVIGVACLDPKDAWENALKKYDLPWVNLYNGAEKGGPVLQEYGIEGFPTKVIVDPEGKVRNVTAGDTPDFYVALDALVK